MEDARLDLDAFVEVYKAGIEKVSGLHTTCISLYEFLRGLAYLKKEVGQYKSHVESHVAVLGLENEAILTASRIFGELEAKGAIVEDPDLLIAGICISNSLPLVTGNARHFGRFAKYGLAVKPLAEFMAAIH